MGVKGSKIEKNNYNLVTNIRLFEFFDLMMTISRLYDKLETISSTLNLIVMALYFYIVF